MGRPRKMRVVGFAPEVTYFKPRAVPLRELEEVKITYDELETLRLSNLLKLSQLDAAKHMDVHQSTFQRTLTRAREKVTDALVNGKAIRINGGEYTMPNRDGTGPVGFRRGPMGMGRGQRGPLGTGGMCICPQCEHAVPHVRGQPCNTRKCPQCGAVMTRMQ